MKEPAARPLTAHEFLRAAEQRLDAANYLLQRATFNVEAYYLAGYAIEFALKCLILDSAPVRKRDATSLEISKGGIMHNYDVLMKRLGKLDRPLPLELVKQLRSSSWSTALR